MSLSARRAWIEISIDDLEPSNTRRSLSARRAWIEITLPSITRYFFDVALRKESVDRNNVRGPTTTRPSIVALRKESVDRNELWMALDHPLKRVALRKESVDRNSCWLLA